MWTLISFAVAGPAQPASAEDVRAGLEALLDPDPKARIAAANTLATTPPALVGHLDPTGIDAVCAEHVASRSMTGMPERCKRWNHAMYHYLRVVGALAAKSADPATPLGAWCLPKTQPAPGRTVDDPACPLISHLRWVVHDGFDRPEVWDFEPSDDGAFDLPEAVLGATLLASARASYEAALSPAVPDAAALARHDPFSVEHQGRRFSVLPICGGRPGFSETCAFHVFVEDGARFQQTSLLPFTPELEASHLYANLRMTSAPQLSFTRDGHHGVIWTDGGGGDDHTRRYTVFDLSEAPRVRCTLEQPMEQPARTPVVTPGGCHL